MSDGVVISSSVVGMGICIGRGMRMGVLLGPGRGTGEGLDALSTSSPIKIGCVKNKLEDKNRPTRFFFI